MASTWCEAPALVAPRRVRSAPPETAGHWYFELRRGPARWARRRAGPRSRRCGRTPGTLHATSRRRATTHQRLCAPSSPLSAVSTGRQPATGTGWKGVAGQAPSRETSQSRPPSAPSSSSHSPSSSASAASCVRSSDACPACAVLEGAAVSQAAPSSSLPSNCSRSRSRGDVHGPQRHHCVGFAKVQGLARLRFSAGVVLETTIYGIPYMYVHIKNLYIVFLQLRSFLTQQVIITEIYRRLSEALVGGQQGA